MLKIIRECREDPLKTGIMMRDNFRLLLYVSLFLAPWVLMADIREMGVCGQFNAADRVVVARVEEVHLSDLKKRDDGELESQEVTFSVLETLKTSNSASRQESVKSITFTVATKFDWFGRSPMIFKSGEDYVLFLRWNKNAYGPVTEWEGALSASRKNRIHIKQCEIEARPYVLLGILRRYLDGVKIDVTTRPCRA
jgi:hypothetical protein